MGKPDSTDLKNAILGNDSIDQEDMNVEDYITSLRTDEDVEFDKIKTEVHDLLRKAERGGLCALLWGWEDVLYCAEDNGRDFTKISKQDAIDIIKEATYNCDAQYGLSWDTLLYYIDGGECI